MLVPEANLVNLADDIRNTFRRWEQFLHRRVIFSLPDSSIHTNDHSGRVLLYALMIGARRYPGDDSALEILAHAALFHDTRRRNDGYDTGHGARASVHYKNFCRHEKLKYHPESAILMRFHDLNDVRGKKAIADRFTERTPYLLDLYAVFKDADALDRWRLGPYGLDVSYLRHNESRELIPFSRNLVECMNFRKMM